MKTEISKEAIKHEIKLLEEAGSLSKVQKCRLEALKQNSLIKPKS